MICYTINETGVANMSKRFDKRIHFIRQALNQKLTVSASAANEWYIANKGHLMDTKRALAEYKIWLGRDSEPNLGQMFDMAYEDQCAAACGP